MFERPNFGEQAILVHMELPEYDKKEYISEFVELAQSAGVQVKHTMTTSRLTPDPKYFIGRGKVDEIKTLISADKIQVVIFNHTLTPAQERNLEKYFNCRVLDRTGLILDIFAQRAQSFEGKLQVELAQLQHLSTRLVRGWTHLERQKGGIGLRGPGETQLETDRRLLRNRIKYIHKRLEKVRSQRHQSRSARQKALLPTVSLVGYTNAGKSTLFNLLTHSEVYVADQLFATLDPSLRKLAIPGAGKIILADTVGFIRHLPHDLVEAFSATLQETQEASLLIHVIDVHDPDRQAHMQEVEQVLEQIEANEIPRLLVYNKIDMSDSLSPGIVRDSDDKPVRVNISAQKQLGIDALMQAISERVFGNPVYRTISLSPQEGKLRSQLYQKGAVQSETMDADGNWILHLKLLKEDYEQMIQHHSVLKAD